MRDPHRDKEKQKRTNTMSIKTRTFGEDDAPDVEEPKGGQAKYSMVYMTMGSNESDSKAPASLVMVNNEDGGVFPYARTGKDN